MAIGNYRLATATGRPVHVGAARATVAPVRAPDVAGAAGSAFDATIGAGVSWYKSVQAVGASLQRIGRTVNKFQSETIANETKAELGNLGVDENGNQTLSPDEWNRQAEEMLSAKREKWDPMQRNAIGSTLDDARRRIYSGMKQGEERRRMAEERELIERIGSNLVY